MTEISIRRGSAGDLEAVAAIQRSSLAAAQWPVADYLDREFYVAVVGNSIAGFLVMRTLTPDEREVLNLAVTPPWRRKGVGRALLEASLKGFQGSVFLEVRESNETARKFYEVLNFKEVSRRPQYYESPPETGIVMKFHSC